MTINSLACRHMAYVSPCADCDWADKNGVLRFDEACQIFWGLFNDRLFREGISDAEHRDLSEEYYKKARAKLFLESVCCGSGTSKVEGGYECHQCLKFTPGRLQSQNLNLVERSSN